MEPTDAQPGFWPVAALAGGDLREDDAVWTGTLGERQIVGSEVLRSYWTLAAERQRVYHARLQGQAPPWTEDPVVTQYRFTNAYRAADRVSQDLIKVIYSGTQDPEDVLLRVLLFRFFNKPETWAALEEARGEITIDDFDVERYSRILDDRLARGQRVYSAAYIVPPPPFGERRKHRNHLRLIEHMMTSGLERDLASAPSLEAVFSRLIKFPSLGPFLAYQLTIDLNYSTLIDFDEDDFVVAGPGALSGLAKCFPNADGVDPADLIRMMVETQNEQLDFYGIDFVDLFGRPLKLIDCQNLFCETDKYARVMHPDRRGLGNRTRIKQQFSPNGRLAAPFFPPKWGLATVTTA
ncbi:nucleotide kinase domain-containing protein [Janibacter massiliensis]|uniref:nucleotide kinase domain-containing protein n=1 Tax=Janibacter massiliensis TaxID=2058291 RepID=UPI00131A4973|nr:nucleotide kinase domain-containing protein [Janibacter massiliensis]